MPYIPGLSFEFNPTEIHAEARTQRALSELASATRILIDRTGAQKRAELTLHVPNRSPLFPGVEDEPPRFLAEHVLPESWFVAVQLARPDSSKRRVRMDSAVYSIPYRGEDGVMRLAGLWSSYYTHAQTLPGNTRVLRQDKDRRPPNPIKVVSSLALAIRALEDRQRRMRKQWQVR